MANSTKIIIGHECENAPLTVLGLDAIVLGLYPTVKKRRKVLLVYTKTKITRKFDP